MTDQILIPHHAWISRVHKREIRKLTSAVILPHDKPFAWSSCDDLQEDVQLIQHYIRERV